MHSFEPGGVERVAMRLAADWSTQGADARMVVGRRDGLAPGAPLPADVFVIGGRLSSRRTETLEMIAGLSAAVQRTSPRVVFLPGNTYAVVGLGLRVVLGSRCPPLVLKISNDLDRADLPALARRTYHRWCCLQGRTFDRIIAPSPSLVPQVVARMSIPADRVAMVLNPVLTSRDWQDRGASSCFRRLQDGRRFVAIGRLAPQKDFGTLIRAFARGARAADRLAIIGEGPERRGLERLTRRLGLVERVELPGHAFDTGAACRGADCFVLSSIYEGVPGVVVEALAAGLPIIATRSSPAIDDLLDGGALGKVVPPGDETALAAAIAEPPAQDVVRARRRAADFMVETAGRDVLAVLESVAQGDPRGA